jgi:hypothetical protein
MFNPQNYVKFVATVQLGGLVLATVGLLTLSHWFGQPLAFFGVALNFGALVYRAIFG